MLEVIKVIAMIVFRAAVIATLAIMWLNLPTIFETIKNFLCQWKKQIEKLIDRLKF